MNIARFNNRVQFVCFEEVADACGFVTNQEQVLLECFAEVAYLKGKEFWEAYGVRQEVTVQIFMRLHPTIAKADTRRVFMRHNEELYDLISIEPIEREFLKLKAVRK